MTEELETPPAAPPSQPGRGGAQLLHELLAIAYHVFEEAKQMNLKPPLQPSSRMFSLDAINSTGPQSPPRSPGPPDSPSDESMSAADMNGSFHSTTTHGHHGSGAMHTPVIPFSPEEIQDSFTRIATLKSQYTKVSTELLEFLKQLEARRQDPELAAKHAADEKETIEKLTERRNHLRREVYERNLVMKGLIDRLRHLQYSMRLIRGGSSNPPHIVMESVPATPSTKSPTMIPPSYVKSVAVKNTTDHRVQITATFGSDEQAAGGNAKIVETRELGAGEETTFAEQEYDMGSWTAVAALDALDVQVVGSNDHKAAFKPQVTGIVDLLNVEVKAQASGALHVAAL